MTNSSQLFLVVYRQLHLTEEQAEKDLHAAMLAENARLEEAQAEHNQRMAEA